MLVELGTFIDRILKPHLLVTGPCNIADANSTKFNPYAWTERANMIFLDQPVGVGFSYNEHGSVVVRQSLHLSSLQSHGSVGRRRNGSCGRGGYVRYPQRDFRRISRPTAACDGRIVRGMSILRLLTISTPLLK
jgi:hypothetical protein